MNKRLYTLLISMVAALGGLLFGFDIAIFSGIIPFIQPYFHLNDVQLGWTGSSLYIGCIIGSLATGQLTDRFGRKFPLLVSALIFSVSCIFTGWSQTYSSLIIWRIIAGIGVGSASVLSPLYIAEISPSDIRGRMVSLNQLAIVTGILLAYFSNYILADFADNWRWMFTSGAFPAGLFLICTLFIPESPRWLILKGNEEKGERILTRLMDKEAVSRELQEIKITVAGEVRGKVSDLFKKGVRYIVFIGIILAVFQQISGANAVFFYAPIIFEKAGMNIKSQLFQQILVGFTNFIFTFLAIRLVDRLGRKKLMVGGSFLIGLWLLIIAAFFHFGWFSGFGLTLFVLLFIATYSTTLAPVTWVLMSEIFPNRIRGTAMSVATGTLWISCFALTFGFPILFGSNNGKGLLSPMWNFVLFSGINFLYFFILLRMVPETKGKTLEEIEMELTKK
ncbi:MAG TPA: sugar porter family MFS transporter [Bacteroidales bacterium]|nr:sugar porter family MFS transporter [Bacteroidales bacterium]